MTEGVLFLVLCAGCSRTYGLPYPPKMLRDSQGRALEPHPWFCQRKPCQAAREARDERLAAQERIGSAHREDNQP